MAKTLVIAGGGLAGLAAGIRSLEKGLAVELHERQHYPLKKVCGEFLSPLGWRRVQALGVEGLKPVALKKARFYSDDAGFFEFELDPPAWGLSRAALDTALAARFRALGGILHEGSSLDKADLNATGRPAKARKGLWMGWKGYLSAGNAPPELSQADLLMLPILGGYCGLSRIEDGRVSVCLTARTPVELGALLGSHPILAGLKVLDAHAAIAGFDFEEEKGVGRLGDAKRVWPPVVGDGMSQALSKGSWTAGLQFRLAKGIHALMLNESGRRRAAAICKAWPALPAFLYRLTRS